MRPHRLVLAAAVLLAAACSPSGHGDFSRPTGSLDIVSWWTSGSESRALDVLVDRFKQAHPDVTVERAAIRGGAGSNVQVALAKRLRDGDPPDLWQTFPGSSLRANAQSGRITDVSAVFETDGLAAAIPAPILDALTWNGRRWGVPTGAHRENMLWFNPAVLKKAGVAAPSASGYTAEKFAADLAALQAHDMMPLCLGSKDRFTTTELFEDVLLGEVGARGWADIAADRFDWDGPAVRKALERFGQILDYVDATASPTWDEAAKQLASGACGFLAMSDSLYGELAADGVAASDIGSTAFPGTDGAFLAVVDTFVAASDAKNGYNALQFLGTIGSASTEVAFAAVKGSAPLRRDADVAALPAYQQSAFKALSTGTILLSITHGELLGTPFQQAFYDGVAAFTLSRDPKDFTAKIQQAATGTVPTGH